MMVSRLDPDPGKVEAIDENGDYCVDNQELLVKMNVYVQIYIE